MWLMHIGRCSSSWDFNCLDQPSVEFPSEKEYCYVYASPVASPVASTSSNRPNYKFRVAYADASDIAKFTLQPADDIFTPIQHLLPSIFLTFPHLKKLVINDSLEELNADDFARANDLIALWLNGNKFNIIRRDVFSPMFKQKTALGHSPLHQLYDLLLAENEIVDIEDYAFAGLNELFDLDLQQNQLTTIHRHTFAGLPSLATLTLDNNQIATIEDGAFDLPALLGLFLNKNKLKMLSTEIFGRMPKIVSIKIEDNDLEHIGQAFEGIGTLQTISLKRNRIVDIDLAILARLPHLIEASLTQSGFTFVTSHIDGDRHWNSSLTELSIDDNNLTDATELEKLRIFNRLEVLNLDRNPFTQLVLRDGQKLKDILPALTVLYLRGTAIDCKNVLPLLQELIVKHVDVEQDCRF